MYLTSVSSELRLYGCESWNHLFSYGSFDAPIKHVEWSDDGKYFLQVNPNGRVEICSATQDGVRCLQCIPDNESSAATFHRGGHRQVAIGCQTGKVYIWDTKFKSILKTFTEASCAVKLIDFNSKNTFLAAGLQNGDTAVYGVTTNHQVGIINFPYKESSVRLDKVSALKFHRDLRSLLGLASDEGCVLVRDLGNGKNKLFMKDGHKSIVSGLAFSRVNQDVMLSCGYDRKMHIYDIRTQSVVHSISTDYALTSVDINPDNFVALGNKKGQLLIYDLRNTTTPVTVINDHHTAITKVSFQPEVDKRKRYMALDVSLKESFNTKTSPVTTVGIKECQTPEAIKSHEFIDQFNSPMFELPSPKREKLDHVDNSRDSFLVNIVGSGRETNASKNSPMFVDSPDNIIQRTSDPANSKLFKNRTRKSGSHGEKLSEVCTAASTPLLERMACIDEVAVPSPIPFGNGMGDYQQDSNENIVSHHSPLKKGDSLDTASGTETVKFTPSIMTELGNELKDFINYSIFDVLEQSKNNFMQITMQQTKNRLHLEDQISLLALRVQELQHNQNILIDENKKLSIEVELLRSTKN